jgi:hypothetical protein
MPLYAKTTRHTEIHDPGNETDIADLFVFLSVDNLGRKGICAHILPNLGSTPLITGSPRVVELMKGMARELSAATGKPIQLYRFKRVPDVLWQTAGEKK